MGRIDSRHFHGADRPVDVSRAASRLAARRERHAAWRKICRSILIELEQEDVDTLTAHTEPDELLAVMIDAGLVDGALPYLDRLADFMPRYERALN